MAISRTSWRASPFLKWAGGKSQLLPILLQHVPTRYSTYIEPFLGGGALFFELQPEKAVLADSNPELINCYQVVRDNVEELIKMLRVYPYKKDFYYSLRAQEPEKAVERAARMIYLNRTCYNGLYRVNTKGLFNVPFGTYKNPLICDAEGLRAASYALRHADLRCADYQEILRDAAQPGDFIYLDPPYHPIARRSNFKRYTAESFSENDQRMLASMVKKLVEHGCYVLLSNSSCDFILNLYQKYEIFEVAAKRNINKDPQKRSGVKEVLVECSKYSSHYRTQQQLALWEAS